MYLEKPKRLIIWNGGSRRYVWGILQKMRGHGYDIKLVAINL